MYHIDKVNFFVHPVHAVIGKSEWISDLCKSNIAYFTIPASAISVSNTN
jgi:hypothetical protein